MTTAPKRATANPVASQVPRRTALGAVILDRPATHADLDALPPTWRGEILHGVLHAFPHPRAPHQQAVGSVFHDLLDPFDRARGGPGGWWVLIGPGIELPSRDEFSPDVAAWRREKMPRLPRRGPITVAPDWICEVISPRTRSYDHVTKRRFYAEVGVSYLWYVDPLDGTLTASKLEGGRWLELGAWCDDETARVEPFEHIELSLAAWWEGIEAEEASEASPPPPSTTS